MTVRSGCTQLSRGWREQAPLFLGLHMTWDHQFAGSMGLSLFFLLYLWMAFTDMEMSVSSQLSVYSVPTFLSVLLPMSPPTNHQCLCENVRVLTEMAKSLPRN